MDGQHTITMMIENELLFKDSIRVYVVNGRVKRCLDRNEKSKKLSFSNGV